MSRRARIGARAKDVANDRANAWLARLGYSEARIRDAKREGWWWLQARAAAAARRRRLLSGWAVTWTGTGRAELVPIEVPRAGRGEVTVSAVASAVSPGTERAQYLRLPNARISFPFRPGYSLAGTVLEVGGAVAGIRPGDLVAVTGAAHASVVTVPADRVYAVPEGVEASAAAFVELGIISGHGVRVARLAPEEAVCILGYGLVGALAQRITTASGAGDVVVAARSRRKEGHARAGGASRFVALDEDARALEHAFSVVVEATGDPAAVPVAIAAAANGGRVVLLGSPRGETRELPVGELAERGVSLVGAHVATLAAEARMTGTDPRRALGTQFLELLREGRVRVDDLVTTVDPREADAFYRELAAGDALVAAVFDWTQLPADERAAPGRVWRVPSLGGAGMEYREKPLPAPRSPAAQHRATVAAASGSLRIGLLGCGDIAVHNAAAIAAAPNTRLAACYDPAADLAEELAERFGAEAVTTADGLLERRDVDAVVLAVPHHLHAPLALDAIAAGKHVVVEKPLANSLSAGLDMVAAAERAGVRLSVCFPHRYQENVQAARRLVEDGALGEVAGTLLTFFADKPSSYWLGGFSGRSVSGWRSSREQAGGGVLIMNLSHYLDLVRYIGRVEAAVCSAATGLVDGPAEVEDTISLTVRYENGGVGTVFGCAALRGNRNGPVELHLWGRDGHLSVEPEAQLYTLRALDGFRPARWQSLATAPDRDIRAAYFSRFATAIDRGDEPDVTAEDGLAVQALIEAAYRSSEQREGVEVERQAMASRA